MKSNILKLYISHGCIGAYGEEIWEKDWSNILLVKTKTYWMR